MKDSTTEVRDKLALDRTAMALERTVLAYVRTALAFLAVGVTSAHFFTAGWLVAAGWSFAGLSIAIAAMGALRASHVLRDLREVKRRERL